jgi:uncharacterized membrane protein YoaK (UPF0700 family)
VVRIRTPEVRNLAWLALLLALVGGFVDAVGYMVFFNLFTAHMSGNSVAMSVHAGEQNWPAALHRAFPIPLFVTGVVVGAFLSETLFRRGVRSTFAPALGVEAILLILFIACGGVAFREGALRPDSGYVFYLLAALPALAMGVQNSALCRIGGMGVRTTFITGMLTDSAMEFVEYVYWLCDHARPGRPGVLLALSPRQRSFRQLGLYFVLWTAYVAGGFTGALTELRWGLLCLLAPVCALICVAVRDLIHPIAPPEAPHDKPEWKA